MKRTNNVSPYRWVILLSIMPIIISTEMMWLSLAPISSLAENYYHVSSMSIAILSMSYMIMYIIFSLPASWVIDKFGYRYSLIIGASLTAVFGLTRALFSDNFTIVLISQFIIAIGQPFLLNISTKVPANWFPINERSTAAGILTMAQYIGFAVPMILSPLIAESSGIPKLLMTFAIIAILSAIISIAFTKEKPAIAPSGYIPTSEDLNISHAKSLFSNKPYMLVLLICFISIGIFNAILTLIEPILLPRGITSVQAGAVGAIFVVTGIVGAVVLPIISDKLSIRVPLFVGTISILVPLFLGLTFISNFFFICITAGFTGFAIMGVAPILFQYGSEVAYPIKEGTSLGVILLMGQISGALFVYIFEAVSGSSGSVILPMLFIVAITALEIPFTLRMKESALVNKNNYSSTI
jgi:MFS transporter, FLVCR family, MFS-domain-containing protein 7